MSGSGVGISRLHQPCWRRLKVGSDRDDGIRTGDGMDCQGYGSCVMLMGSQSINTTAEDQWF